MPDSYGKRQRNQVKAKKAAAREERRLARNRRRAQREDGLPADYTEEGSSPPETDPEAEGSDVRGDRTPDEAAGSL
jgi:hypothetical protein